MPSLKSLLFLILSLVFFAGNTFSQDSSHVQWNSTVKNISGSNYEVILKGSIQNGWHVYSTVSEADGLTGISIQFDDSAVLLQKPLILSNEKIIRDLNFEKELRVSTDSISIKQLLYFKGEVPPVIKFTLTYFTGLKDNFIPEEQKITIVLNKTATRPAAARILIPSIDLKKPVTNCGESSASMVETKTGNNLFNLFILGFLGGLIALLTPCV
ncbi:MAG: hypothetical protein KBF74_05720, partial [Ferruginibacter sp.]|nr:hypothetical protein [Ferruginibacter sp.]